MFIPQIPKMQGRLPEAWAAQVADTLNPALRNAFFAGAFRWSEIEGQNGASPTLALQVAGRDGTWATVAQFDVNGRLVQPAWTNLTLSNAWTNADVAAPCGVLLGSTGFVSLRGRAKSPGVAAGVSITTLPTTYRPKALKSFGTVILQAAGTWAPGQLDIATDGTCKLYPATVVNDLFLFENIRFDTR